MKKDQQHKTETNGPNLHTEQLWNVKQLKKVMGLSERTLWRLNDSGKLPVPIRIGNSVRWRQGDIETWIRLGCPDRATFEAAREVAHAS